jgi:hypothetical protein
MPLTVAADQRKAQRKVAHRLHAHHHDCRLNIGNRASGPESGRIGEAQDTPAQGRIDFYQLTHLLYGGVALLHKLHDGQCRSRRGRQAVGGF